MFLKLLALAVIGFSLAAEPLYETSGFHCKTKLSMRLDRRLHGEPRDAPPPFDVQVLDEEGHQTEYYEPGKIYTIRLIGYQYYRGLLLQPRLCDEHGFVIGSLRGGRFLETPDWIQYGIRLQECDMKYPLEDSVTHADDNRKFVTQVQWTAGRDVGNVQFMFTIVSENDVYWERWRPRSGFLQPIYSKQFPSEVLRQVFYNEKYALKFLAGKFTSSQESKTASSKEAMPKLEEFLIATEKPEMPMEAKKVLEKMEMPEFWSHHDGEVKIKKDDERKTDNLENKQKKESETDFISDNKNSGEAKVNEEMVEEITESDEERDEEKPFIGSLMNETTTNIPEHESITHLPETKTSKLTADASLDSGEATVQPSEPETLKDEKPLKPAFEEAFSHDDVEVKEVEVTIAPKESEVTTEAMEISETILNAEEEGTTANPIKTEAIPKMAEEATTVIPTKTTSDEAEITTSVSEQADTTTENVTDMPSEDPTITGNPAEGITETMTEQSTVAPSDETQTEKVEEETTKSVDVKGDDETIFPTSDVAENSGEATTMKEERETISMNNEETTVSLTESETTAAENAEANDEATSEMPEEIEETTTLTAEEEMKDIENDLLKASEKTEATTESDNDEITTTESAQSETMNETDIPMNDEMKDKNEATTEESVTESEMHEAVDTTMNDDVTEKTTEMPMKDTKVDTTPKESVMEEKATTSEASATNNDANEETTEASVTEAAADKEDEATTLITEEKEQNAEIQSESITPSEITETTTNTEEHSTSEVSEVEETTVFVVETTATEPTTSESPEEMLMSTVVNANQTVEATTPTFDELITTLPTFTETSSSVDVDSTSEASSHPKDISRRRR